MVRAAQKAAFDKADDHNVVVKTKFVGGIAQVGTSSSIYDDVLNLFSLLPKVIQPFKLI